MDINSIVQQVYERLSAGYQFNISRVPYHTHSKMDSNSVAWGDLTGRQFSISYTLFGANAATAANYSVFFTSPSQATVIQITEVHTTAGSDGSAVSLDIEKLTGTTAPGSGTALTATVFNLKGTANTVSTATATNKGLTTNASLLQVAQGDRLALKLTGTPTSVANVTVTVLFQL